MPGIAGRGRMAPHPVFLPRMLLVASGPMRLRQMPTSPYFAGGAWRFPNTMAMDLSARNAWGGCCVVYAGTARALGRCASRGADSA
eukprot:1083670-Alexandrium_andersonii.AAC.1